MVTGGAGFLGSHLCRHLLARGDEVVAVDNLSTGRRDNVAELEDGARLRAGRRRRLRTSSRYAGRSTACCTSRARRARPSTSRCRSRRWTSSSLGTRRALDLAPRARRAVPVRVDERDLRRSARAPAARGLQRQRRPDRTPRGLRRSEAVRRDADDRRTTVCYDLDTAIVRIFNTYGPRSAAGRRPGRVELPGAGGRRASR